MCAFEWRGKFNLNGRSLCTISIEIWKVLFYGKIKLGRMCAIVLDENVFICGGFVCFLNKKSCTFLRHFWILVSEKSNLVLKLTNSLLTLKTAWIESLDFWKTLKNWVLERIDHFPKNCQNQPLPLLFIHPFLNLSNSIFQWLHFKKVSLRDIT